VKLCIWYRSTDDPWGGSNSFLHSLGSCLAARGIEVVPEPAPDCAAVILNSFTRGGESKISPASVAALRVLGRVGRGADLFPVSFWRRLARGSRVPLVHRLDGVTRLYGRTDNADELQLAVNVLTDATVFQGEYCRASFAQLGIVPKKWRIVPNGVDTALFRPNPTGRRPGGKPKLAAVSWSTNVQKGFPLLAQLGKRRDVEVSFVGNWNRDYDPGGIRLIAPLRRQALAEFLRTQEGFVHAAENDPCSNALLEGLASGLPALYHPSGGNPELAGLFGCPLSGDWDLDLEAYRERYDLLRGDLLAQRERFSIARAADGYLALAAELGGKGRADEG
jgi:glycosyltransferase involved in cell wall biosynthesis